MPINLVHRMKRVLRTSEIRLYVRQKRQRWIFDKALQEFSESPWAALNSHSGVLGRLVKGWGNQYWSADDEYLLAIIDEFSRTDGPVLECGSGLSTVILGVLAGVTGREVWTLEHDPEWAKKVEKVLNSLQLTSVRICVKPLKDYGDFAWYDPPLESMPADFSLVICDGPPGTGHGGRSGLLPVMKTYLAERVSILMDDVERDDEKALTAQWSESLPATVANLGVNHAFATIRAGQPKRDTTAENAEDLPVVTVGIPAFNSEKTIGLSIDSVLKQSVYDIRVLVSDNHSNDRTSEICLQRVRGDLRLSFLPQIRNIGVFENYNELFLKCKTKYFKWQSSSDWIDTTLLSTCIDVLDARPDVVLVCPKVWLASEDSKLSEYDDDFGLEMDDPAERFAYLCDNIQLCNLFNGVIRASALRSTHLNRPFYGSDITLLAELALRGKFVLVPERLWYRRMTPAAASKLQSAEQREEFFSGAPSGVGRYVTWKQLSALFVAALSSRNSLMVRLGCVKYVLRRAILVRRDLFRELFSHL